MAEDAVDWEAIDPFGDPADNEISMVDEYLAESRDQAAE